LFSKSRTVGVIVSRDSCSVKDIKRPGNISRPSSQIQGLFKDIEGHVSANSRTKYWREGALEISKIWSWIVQNATSMSFIRLWTCKINSTKCPFLNVNQFQKISKKLKQEEFKDFQALLYKFKDIQGLEFLFSNSRTFKFCTNPVRRFERRPFVVNLVTWTAGKAQLISRATLLPLRRSAFARITEVLLGFFRYVAKYPSQFSRQWMIPAID
jgi:hypothetical protein